MVGSVVQVGSTGQWSRSGSGSCFGLVIWVSNPGRWSGLAIRVGFLAGIRVGLRGGGLGQVPSQVSDLVLG